MLSLQYCGITEEAAQAIFEILIYTRSALEDLNLNGNNLGNEGVKTVLTGTSIAKSLKKLHIADNQWNDEEDVLRVITSCWVKN